MHIGAVEMGCVCVSGGGGALNTVAIRIRHYLRLECFRGTLTGNVRMGSQILPLQDALVRMYYTATRDGSGV